MITYSNALVVNRRLKTVDNGKRVLWDKFTLKVFFTT